MRCSWKENKQYNIQKRILSECTRHRNYRREFLRKIGRTPSVQILIRSSARHMVLTKFFHIHHVLYWRIGGPRYTYSHARVCVCVKDLPSRHLDAPGNPGISCVLRSERLSRSIYLRIRIFFFRERDLLTRSIIVDTLFMHKCGDSIIVNKRRRFSRRNHDFWYVRYICWIVVIGIYKIGVNNIT